MVDDTGLPFDVTICAKIGCILGISGSMFMLVTYTAIEKLRKQFLYYSVIHLSGMNFFFTLGGLISLFFASKADVCMIAAITLSFGEFATFFWTLTISWTLHDMFLYSRQHLDLHVSKWWFPVVLYFTTALCVTTKFLLQDFIQDSSPFRDGTCVAFETIGTFLKPGGEAKFNYLSPLSFVLLVMTLVIEVIIYTRIALHVRREMYGDAAKEVLLQLVWYPLILIFCWGLGAVYYLMFAIEASNIKPLADLFLFLVTAQGLINAFVYGLSYSVRGILKDKCCRRFKHRRSYSVDENRVTLMSEEQF